MSDLPNYRALRLFLSIAAEGTFSAAAERLGLSQPTISQQIKALEKEIGLALFHRSGRNAKLTAAGESLRRGLEPGFTEIEDAYARARNQGDAPDTVTVATVHTLFSYFLPEIVFDYLSDEPLARPDIRGRSSADVVRMTMSGEVDFGLIYDTEYRELTVNSIPLFVEDIVAVYPPDIGFGSHPGPCELTAGTPIVAFQRGYALRSLVDRMTRETPISIVAEVDSIEMTLTMTAAMRAVTLLPRGLAEARAPAHGLLWREIDTPRITRTVVAIFREDRRLRPMAGALLTRCIETARGYQQAEL